MKELKAFVKQNEARLTRRDYNTNNAWGFEGSYGTEFTLPDGKTFVRIGRACFRRGPTEPCVYAGERLGDRDTNYRRLKPEEFFERATQK